MLTLPAGPAVTGHTTYTLTRPGASQDRLPATLESSIAGDGPVPDSPRALPAWPVMPLTRDLARNRRANLLIV